LNCEALSLIAVEPYGITAVLPRSYILLALYYNIPQVILQTKSDLEWKLIERRELCYQC
jgi:hypothetical protein